MRKALILTWEKFQDVELIYAYYKLQEEFSVDVAANKLGIIYGVNGVKINANLFSNEACSFNSSVHVKVNDYELVLVVGGVLSVEYARQNKVFIDLLKEFNSKDKVIASICHGAQYLIEADLVKRKNIAGYYSIKKDIENAGGRFVDGVSIDGNIVTAAHYKHQTKWLQEVVRVANERKKL